MKIIIVLSISVLLIIGCAEDNIVKETTESSVDETDASSEAEDTSSEADDVSSEVEDASSEAADESSIANDASSNSSEAEDTSSETAEATAATSPWFDAGFGEGGLVITHSDGSIDLGDNTAIEFDIKLKTSDPANDVEPATGVEVRAMAVGDVQLSSESITGTEGEWVHIVVDISGDIEKLVVYAVSGAFSIDNVTLTGGTEVVIYDGTGSVPGSGEVVQGEFTMNALWNGGGGEYTESSTDETSGSSDAAGESSATVIPDGGVLPWYSGGFGDGGYKITHSSDSIDLGDNTTIEFDFKLPTDNAATGTAIWLVGADDEKLLDSVFVATPGEWVHISVDLSERSTGTIDNIGVYAGNGDSRIDNIKLTGGTEVVIYDGTGSIDGDNEVVQGDYTLNAQAAGGGGTEVPESSSSSVSESSSSASESSSSVVVATTGEVLPWYGGGFGDGGYKITHSNDSIDLGDNTTIEFDFKLPTNNAATGTAVWLVGADDEKLLDSVFVATPGEWVHISIDLSERSTGTIDNIGVYAGNGDSRIDNIKLTGGTEVVIYDGTGAVDGDNEVVQGDYTLNAQAASGGGTQITE